MTARDRVDHILFEGQPAVQLVTADGARACVSLFGGQVLSWEPPGSGERLFLSKAAAFDARTPIRGGVPVSFPQFAAQGRLPRHGLVRSMPWEVVSERCAAGYVMLNLRCSDTPQSLAAWPHAFELELTVLLEANRLALELEVANPGHASFAFAAALHTYLRTREVEEARLEGLGGGDYLDCTAGRRKCRDSGEFVAIDAEIDRIYTDVRRPLLLREPNRSLGIHAEGFPDVVVWNPWEDKCAAMADMAASDFRRMLCVEAALTRPLELAAGESWCGRQTFITLD